MDRFNDLISKLEKLLEGIEKQQKAKEQEYNSELKDKQNSENKQKELEAQLKQVSQDLSLLITFKNKNIIVETTKKVGKILAKDFQKNIENKNFFGVILLGGFIIMIIAGTIAFSSLDLLLITISLIAIMLSILSGMMFNEVHKLRKKFTIEELEQEKKNIEEKLTSIKKQIQKYNNRLSEIQKEREKLNAEEKQCLTDIQVLKQSRIQSMEQLISEEKLNEAFNEVNFNDIITRVRSRKEGE